MSEQDESVTEVSAESAETVVDPPERPQLDPNDPKTRLYEDVRGALLALPGQFNFDHSISGINATDLHNLNTLIGAAIETEVVRSLNTLRHLWDPDNKWAEYAFQRSSQAFPDVRLVKFTGTIAAEEPPALGIELKGWYLLSAEATGSFRYKVSPNACAPHDLVSVVPWYLSNAVSGVAQVTEPWVESARFAAEYRDWWWQNIKRSEGSREIHYPPDAAPYPSKADFVVAKPEYDPDNFGRLPRCKGLMDVFVERSNATPILGIPAEDWSKFLQWHKSSATREFIAAKLGAEIKKKDRTVTPEKLSELLRALEALRDTTGWLDEE
ncbi:hypothetical protein PJJ83_07940 [Mycobacterium kansasii]